MTLSKTSNVGNLGKNTAVGLKLVSTVLLRLIGVNTILPFAGIYVSLIKTAENILHPE